MYIYRVDMAPHTEIKENLLMLFAIAEENGLYLGGGGEGKPRWILYPLSHEKKDLY